MIDGTNIVVSFTCLPGRIQTLEPLIKSLKSQTLQPDRIHLWLCPYYKRLNQHLAVQDVPASIRADETFIVDFVQDMGPLTKLYPAIVRYENTETIIVIIDDDRHFGPQFLEDLISVTMKLNATCGYRGRQFRTPSYRYKESILYSFSPEDNGTAIRVDKPTPVDILTGTGGIAFPPKVLDQRFLTFWQNNVQKFEMLQTMCDDVWISGYLAMNHHKRFVLPCPSGIERISNQQADSLWIINQHSSYNDESIETFLPYWDQSHTGVVP